jgi:ABC-type branched-subunit amino acid transport system substrate-binding protein
MTPRTSARAFDQQYVRRVRFEEGVRSADHDAALQEPDPAGVADDRALAVTEEPDRGDDEETVIGPVRFDRNGDLVSPPVTILKIEPGARELPNFPDAVAEAVVRP